MSQFLGKVPFFLKNYYGNPTVKTHILRLKLHDVLLNTNILGLYISVVSELWIGLSASEKPDHSHNVIIPSQIQAALTFSFSCTSQRHYTILYLGKMSSLSNMEEISVQHISETLFPH
jgi:hypothetical protein